MLGREYKGSLLNRSMRGKGIQMSVALRRLKSGLRCACVCQVFEGVWCVSIVYRVHESEFCLCDDFVKW